MKINKISRRAFLLGLGAVSAAAVLTCFLPAAAAHPPLLPHPALLHPAVPQLLAVTCSARWTRSRRTAP